MKKRRKPFHDQKDENGQNCKERDNWEQQQDAIGGVDAEAHAHQHGPQDIRQLCMSQAECPEPQVGGGVGDASQTVLNGMDYLSH